MGAHGWTYFVVLVVLFVSLSGKRIRKPKIMSEGKAVVVKINNNAGSLGHIKKIETELNQIKKKLESLDNKVTSLVSSSGSQTCKFDFEAGIHDWEKTGSAFNNQPTYGDNPTARNKGQRANQQGDWWIGGAEDRPSKSARAGQIQGDAPKGTLTSPYFRIIGGHISFLIGGGCDIKTVRAELIVGKKVVRSATGECNETMKRKAWNVHAYVGRRARVKLVDFSSGHWGHLNFDDLKGDISCS
ncbi:PREDICTED: uncharacterized protein LOC107347206 isoform X2 [Acropora digitifera]|uniref:uncharacterized protein LOC107347206 isoform X2 n=1 Tax=Acropora digitifera TaxID=70779 RepID=UPI00077B2201|nr:PREDICTED: uncharacterized protein LOC107347206 isoform X2 [Acropora digitifera]